MTKLDIHHTQVTPESKATSMPHPPVGRDVAMLSPESGNNSVSKGPIKIPVETLAATAVKPPWQK